MNKLNIISLLKFCAFTVFLGRAYQFYFFGAPFRAILWDESFMTPIVEGVFKTSWYDYATNTKVSFYIDGFTRFCSVVLLISAIVSLFWYKIKFIKLKKIILGCGLFILFILGICMVKDKNYSYSMFFEMMMQFAAPVILFKYSKDLIKIDDYKKLLLPLKIAIALTFIPHGLFAMDIFFIPGHFVDMTIKILGMNEEQAVVFLFVAGFIDIIFSILIFIPKISKYVLFYMIIWGFLTALARPVSAFNSDFVVATLHGSLYLMIYRLSHGLIPLITLLMENKIKIKK